MSDPVIFVDLGAFDGRSTRLYEKLRPIKKAYLWECHPDIVIKPPKCDHEIIRAAAWTYDGEIEFYAGQHRGKVTQGSSLLASKTTGWLDKEKPLTVPCLCFHNKLCHYGMLHSPSPIVVKMNIEGAEYMLLDKLSSLFGMGVEWHISWHSEKVGLPASTDDEWRDRLRAKGNSQIPSPFPGHEGWRR